MCEKEEHPNAELLASIRSGRPGTMFFFSSHSQLTLSGSVVEKPAMNVQHHGTRKGARSSF